MGTGETLHEPFVSKVLIYSPVPEVNITLGWGGRGGWVGLDVNSGSQTSLTHTLFKRPSGTL